MAEEDKGDSPNDSWNDIQKAAATLRRKASTLERAIKDRPAPGGATKAVERLQSLADESKQFLDVAGRRMSSLQEAAEVADRELLEEALVALRDYAKKEGLSYSAPEGANAPLTFAIGPYTFTSKGSVADVDFARNKVGRVGLGPSVLEEFRQIRQAVERTTPDFAGRLRVAVRKIKDVDSSRVPPRRLLQALIVELQPPSFWAEATPKNLTPYTIANFVWDLRQAARTERPPFRLVEGTVGEKVAAAGRGARQTGGMYLLSPHRDRPTYCSLIRFVEEE